MAENKTPKDPFEQNLTRLGGPLFGILGKLVFSLTRSTRNAATKNARSAGERFQGRMAHSAEEASNPVERTVRANLGGQVLPTRRATAARIARGNAQNAEDNKLSTDLLRARSHAAYREGGVSASKRALVEACARGGRDAEQAIVMLLGSDSFPEFQDAFISRGRQQGKRVTETGAWQRAISDPEHPERWAKVAGKRPDLTPDVLQGAENALSAAMGFRFRYDDVEDATHRDILNELSRLGMHTAIDRFSIDSIRPLHEGFFNQIGYVNDAGLSQALFDRLQLIKGIGLPGIDAIGSLVGPRSAAVDAALLACGKTYADI